MRLAVALVLASSVARAEPPRAVVGVPVFALSSRAVAVEGELPVAVRISAGGAVGVRDPAGGDFGGYAVAAGPAVRLWRRVDQRGLHGVARIEASVVELRRAGASLGTAFELAPSVGFGYRFVVRDRVTITPDLGLGGEIDFAHRSIPTQRRWTLLYGLSIGGRW